MVQTLPLVVGYVIFIADNILRELLRIRRVDPPTHKVSLYADRSSIVVGIVYPTLILLAPLMGWLGEGGNIPVQLSWLGLSLMVAGMTVHVVAYRTLGRFYTGTLSIVQNHKLVTQGLYKYVRHPGYFGVLLITFGFGLASANWYVLLVMLIGFCTAYSYRMHAEEKMLNTTLGNEYRRYARRTKRIIPFVF